MSEAIVFPISVPKGWALPIIGICVAIVVGFGLSLLAQRELRRRMAQA